MKVVENAIIAGYNYTQGNTSNPTQSSSAPADTELGQTFASSSNAVIWATDVLGEFEINNKEPITKIGSGLHPITLKQCYFFIPLVRCFSLIAR
jgi:hypothetical protein